MRYFKLIKNYFPVSSFQIQEQIYPEDYKIGGVTVETYVKNANYFGKEYFWQEVSEKEYWQQELDKGNLVQGSYYTIKESGVIFKYDGTEHSYYYLGWSTDSSGVDNFYRDNGRFTLKTKNYRLSTDEEIEWIETCNRADKFISKEEFMGSKEFKLPEMWSVEVTSDEQFHIVRKYITKHINERFNLKSESGFKEYVAVYEGSCCYNSLKAAGLLDIWFEPIYEERYKIGDWIVCEDYKNLNIGAEQITGINKNYICIGKEAKEYTRDYILRKATPEEIEEAQTPKVSILGYKAQFKTNSVQFGCQEYDKDFIIKLDKMLQENGFGLYNGEEDLNGKVKEIAKYFKNK